MKAIGREALTFVSGIVLLVMLIALVFYATPLAILVAMWVFVFGTLGALLAPNRGMTPRDGFVIAGIFGVFGLAFIALKEH